MPSISHRSDERVHRNRNGDNESLITIASGEAGQVEIPDLHTEGWGCTSVISGNTTEAFA